MQEIQKFIVGRALGITKGLIVLLMRSRAEWTAEESLGFLDRVKV